VQDSVLQALQGTQYRLLHRYAASPFLALEVGPDALNALKASPLVISVVPDINIEPKGERQ